jgi:hypothetical protein
MELIISFLKSGGSLGIDGIVHVESMKKSSIGDIYTLSLYFWDLFTNREKALKKSMMSVKSKDKSLLLYNMNDQLSVKIWQISGYIKDKSR